MTLSDIASDRADSRFAPSQWEMVLQSNAVSHWLGANQESALLWHGQCDFDAPQRWNWLLSSRNQGVPQGPIYTSWLSKPFMRTPGKVILMGTYQVSHKTRQDKTVWCKSARCYAELLSTVGCSTQFWRSRTSSNIQQLDLNSDSF